MTLPFLFKIFLVLTGIMFACSVYSSLVFFFVLNSKKKEKKIDDFGILLNEMDFSSSEQKKQYLAKVRCNTLAPTLKLRYKSVGYTDCRTQNQVFNGNLICECGCLGLDTCRIVCPTNAICIQKGTISISSACNGCGLCIEICPKKLLVLVSADSKEKMVCAAHNRIDAHSFCLTAENGYLI